MTYGDVATLIAVVLSVGMRASVADFLNRDLAKKLAFGAHYGV